MYLEPLAFNALLSHLGQSFNWSRAYACPCVNPATGAPDHLCPRCGGKGRIWGTASAGMAGIASAEVQREWAQFGTWEQGDVVLTLPSDSTLYGMSQFDRVVMLNSTTPFSVVLDAGITTLPYIGATIDRVFWLHPTTRVIVDGAIPTVTEAGGMTWVTPAPPAPPGLPAPPSHLQYSVSGRRLSDYFCFGAYPQDRAHHSGRALPRRSVLRRFDLYGR